MAFLTQDEFRKTSELMSFTDSSPTEYHALSETEKLLVKSGALKLDWDADWKLSDSTLYYVIHNTALAAFSTSASAIKKGINIAAAHTDSPGFKIKSYGSKIDFGCERLSVEKYGSPILYSWFDRPLALAGRVYALKNGKPAAIDVDTKDSCTVIPSPAPHVLREINDGVKFSVQNELSPLFAQSLGGEKKFITFLANLSGVKENEILSFDIMPYDSNKASFTGADSEFISAGRLDDLAMVYAIFSCIEKNCPGNFAAFAFDNEECGSRTNSGAAGAFGRIVLERLCASFGLNRTETLAAISNSTVISADMAHSTHPAYPGKSDPDIKINMNCGPVLKTSSNQSYASSAKGSAIFKSLCMKANIPYQEFTNHSDMPSGGTIGPMLASGFASMAIDIGAPMLSMHSSRELCGSKDPFYTVKLFKNFFYDI